MVWAWLMKLRLYVSPFGSGIVGLAEVCKLRFCESALCECLMLRVVGPQSKVREAGTVHEVGK